MEDLKDFFKFCGMFLLKIGLLCAFLQMAGNKVQINLVKKEVKRLQTKEKELSKIRKVTCVDNLCFNRCNNIIRINGDVYEACD